MGYERNDRRFDRDRGYGYGYGSRPREYDSDRSRRTYGYYDRQDRYDRPDRFDRPPADYEYDERGFFDRAGDEVRSWFGDEEAERRRRYDARYDERYGREWDDDRGRYRAGPGGFGLGGSYRSDLPRDRGSRSYADPHYREWRDRQMAEYDRDYDAYRKENQSRFDSDFGTWRSSRQEKRTALDRVKEHQEVIGSDGKHIGTVDKVRDERIILTKNDQSAGGHHHSIPLSWIDRVDEKVHVSKTADQAIAHWKDEERSSSRARWLRDDEDSSDGPHYLNRSFSGTY